MTTSWHPTRRYSAVAVMSQDLDRVVLIHKLRPSWQAGKANMPGGKVEHHDYFLGDCYYGLHDDAHLRCAVREMREETGLDVDAAALRLFCKLRFRTPEGDAGECCFYAVRGDVDAAMTMESERVFVADVDRILVDGVAFHDTYRSPDDADFQTSSVQTSECPILFDEVAVTTMPNLPFLVAMGRACLVGGDTTAAWPLTVYEAGAL